MREFSRFHRRLNRDVRSPRVRWTIALEFGRGVLIAVGKTAAAVLTGSVALLAEAVHSWVAAVSDVFLVAGYLAARRPADAAHPLGYGRESFVWSLFASIGMFVVGAQVAVWRGLAELDSNDLPAHYGVGYAVLGISLASQATSFVRALRFVRARAVRRESSVLAHVLDTSDAQLRAVVTGDLIALLALVAATLGMAAHQLTGDAVYDALGSLTIGALMVVAGAFLINQNRRYLVGVPLSAQRSALAIQAIERDPRVARVGSFFAEYVGPDLVVIVVRVVVAGEHDQAGLARILQELEQRVMEHDAVERAIFSLAAPEDGGPD